MTIKSNKIFQNCSQRFDLSKGSTFTTKNGDHYGEEMRSQINVVRRRGDLRGNTHHERRDSAGIERMRAKSRQKKNKRNPRERTQRVGWGSSQLRMPELRKYPLRRRRFWEELLPRPGPQQQPIRALHIGKSMRIAKNVV